MAIVLAVDDILKGKDIKTGDIVEITGEAAYRMWSFKEEDVKVNKFFIPVNYKGRACEIKMGKKAADALAVEMDERDTAKWIGKKLMLIQVKFDKGPGIQVQPVQAMTPEQIWEKEAK
jgi:hypothetical protein